MVMLQSEDFMNATVAQATKSPHQHFLSFEVIGYVTFYIFLVVTTKIAFVRDMALSFSRVNEFVISVK
jgi:hypothetical protein